VIPGGSGVAKQGPGLSLTGAVGVEPGSQVMTKYQERSRS